MKTLLKAGVMAGLVMMLAVGCGYRVASKNRLAPTVETIAILPIRNETTTFKVEQILTESLVETFLRKSPYRITRDVSSADAVFEGVVSSLDANPVTFGQQTFGSTFLVTLRARVHLREKETGKTLFENDHYVFRDQYVINTDVSNFFSELNPALHRIADDFAVSVVSTILEGF